MMFVIVLALIGFVGCACGGVVLHEESVFLQERLSFASIYRDSGGDVDGNFRRWSHCGHDLVLFVCREETLIVRVPHTAENNDECCLTLTFLRAGVVEGRGFVTFRAKDDNATLTLEPPNEEERTVCTKVFPGADRPIFSCEYIFSQRLVHIKKFLHCKREGRVFCLKVQARYDRLSRPIVLWCDQGDNGSEVGESAHVFCFEGLVS